MSLFKGERSCTSDVIKHINSGEKPRRLMDDEISGVLYVNCCPLKICLAKRLMARVRNSNLGLCFFAFKCCVSQLSLARFGKIFEGVMTLGQVKSSPNFCSFGQQRAEKRNI